MFSDRCLINLKTITTVCALRTYMNKVVWNGTSKYLSAIMGKHKISVVAGNFSITYLLTCYDKLVVNELSLFTVATNMRYCAPMGN